MASAQGLLTQKLAHLRRLRADSDKLFRTLEDQLSADAARFDKQTAAVDAVGTVLTLGVHLTALISKGFQAMRLTGSALETINREMGRDALKMAYGPPRDIVAEQASRRLGASTGLSHYFGTALHVFANLETPSFWAAAYTNAREHKSLDQIANSRASTLLDGPLLQIQTQHRETIGRIDQEIRRTEAQLKTL